METFRKKKYLGQHFLADKNTARKIVALLETEVEGPVVEIGPGLGALTEFLAETPRNITAIEVDRKAIPLLEETIARRHWENVRVLHQDILSFDLTAFAEKTGSKLHLIGNLPYNISTPILFHVFAHHRAVSTCTFMLQKEVAERVVAMHGSKTFGRLAIYTQIHADAELAFSISPALFQPKPKVWSSIVRLRMNPARLERIDNYRQFRTLVNQTFTMRRKMLSNSLKGLGFSGPAIPESVQPMLSKRPEQLSIDEFIWLSNTLYSQSNSMESQEV